MTFQDALDADRAQDLQTAASRYEELLADGDADLEVLLNLAALYWQATDPGMAVNFPLKFFARAGERYPELLAEAERRFPMSTEARFWRRYITWTDLGGPFVGRDECLELLREDPASLVPVMCVFADSRGKEAAAEALELLRRCHEDGTTRARYVASVIEAVLGRSV